MTMNADLFTLPRTVNCIFWITGPTRSIMKERICLMSNLCRNSAYRPISTYLHELSWSKLSQSAESHWKSRAIDTAISVRSAFPLFARVISGREMDAPLRIRSDLLMWLNLAWSNSVMLLLLYCIVLDFNIIYNKRTLYSDKSKVYEYYLSLKLML